MALVKSSPLAAYLVDPDVKTAEEAAAKGLEQVETAPDGAAVFGTYNPPKPKAKGK